MVWYMGRIKASTFRSKKVNFWKTEKVEKHKLQKKKILNCLDKNGMLTQDLDKKVLRETKYICLGLVIIKVEHNLKNRIKMNRFIENKSMHLWKYSETELIFSSSFTTVQFATHLAEKILF